GNGTGTVTSTPAGINCGQGQTACTASFPVGTQVTLNANPGSNTQAPSWTGDCTGTSTSTCSLTVNGTSAVSATFPRQTFNLTVSLSGGNSNSGAGADYVNFLVGQTGRSCTLNTPGSSTSTCTFTFDYGTVLSTQIFTGAGSTLSAVTGTGPASS